MFISNSRLTTCHSSIWCIFGWLVACIAISSCNIQPEEKLDLKKINIQPTLDSPKSAALSYCRFGQLNEIANTWREYKFKKQQIKLYGEVKDIYARSKFFNFAVTKLGNWIKYYTTHNTLLNSVECKASDYNQYGDIHTFLIDRKTYYISEKAIPLKKKEYHEMLEIDVKAYGGEYYIENSRVRY